MLRSGFGQFSLTISEPRTIFESILVSEKKLTRKWVHMALSVAQKDHFDREGFVVVRQGLQDKDISPVIEEYEEFISARALELRDEGKIEDLHETEPFERRLIHLHRQCNEIYPHLDIMHLRGKEMFRFLRNETLLDMVEDVLGTSEITCNPIQHMRPKLPVEDPEGGHHIAKWHQDIAVMLEEADPIFILTVWIALAEATPENGCMEIIPRIQGQGLLHKTSAALTPEEMPKGEQLALPMHKGDVLLMHKEIPHRSYPNQSETVRWSIDLRFQPTGTPTGRYYWPDFPVRSKSNPDSVLVDHEVWSNMWQKALSSDSPASYRWG